MSPNEFSKNEESFTAMTMWSPKTGLYLFINVLSLCHQLNSGTPFIVGFHPKINRLQGPYYNFGGGRFRVVMPGLIAGFCKNFEYPDGSTVRSGIDFEAAHYLSEALNIKLE